MVLGMLNVHELCILGIFLDYIYTVINGVFKSVDVILRLFLISIIIELNYVFKLNA